MIALTVALAVLVGISLGLLGGGGSILTVPLLAYVAGLDAKQAIATSLLVVGVTSAVGAISHKFGWFVLVMSSAILAQEVHLVVGIAAAGLTVVAAVMNVVCTRYAHCPLRRIAGQHSLAAAAT